MHVFKKYRVKIEYTNTIFERIVISIIFFYLKSRRYNSHAIILKMNSNNRMMNPVIIPIMDPIFKVSPIFPCTRWINGKYMNDVCSCAYMREKLFRL